MGVFSVKKEGSCDYTVKVGLHHSIHTVVTNREFTATEWLEETIKTRNTNCLPETVLVGFSIEHSRRRNTPYGFIILSTDARCLIYLLDHRRQLLPELLVSFLDDRSVFVVGMGIKAKARRLKRDFGLKIKNTVDLNELAVRGMKKTGLRRYDLDGLVLAVLRNVVVVRFEKITEWFKTIHELTEETVLHATADAHLCFRIAFELYNMIHGSDFISKNKKKRLRTRR